MSRRSRAAWLAAVVIWCVTVAIRGTSAAGQRDANTAPLAADIPDGEGAGTLRARCLACHGAVLITQQRLSRDAWSRELDKMIGWGAAVPADERALLLNYLTLRFGDEPAAVSAAPAGDGAAVLKMRCQVCHDLGLIEQQQLDRAGWTREIDKMIGWGAVLTAAEKETLVAHLSRSGS